MHTKRIIPCLDVKAGRVVKGVNFVNLIDAGDPVEIAAAYDKAGADELVFLDNTASSDARNIMIDMVRKVAEKVFIPFTVGEESVPLMILRQSYEKEQIRFPLTPQRSIPQIRLMMLQTNSEASVLL